ncbi:type 1 fimbrial protein [Lysobacter enzymogenes]|nr:fimbrial protein [Lysobacter enzymogenes]QCW24371.1 type 1 fimbrial protein [Lysobacter enzymogenes]
MRAERAGRRFPDAAAAAVAACAPLAAGAAGAQCAAPAERAIAIDASIAVPRDRPAGSVLYAADYPLPAPAPGCAEAAQDGGWRYAQTPHPSQAEDIYRTGVAAIGVRLSIDGRPLPAAEFAAVAMSPSTRGTLRLELVKLDAGSGGGAIRGADLPTLVYRGGVGAEVGAGDAIAARVNFTGAIAVRGHLQRAEPAHRAGADRAAGAGPAGASAGAKDFDLRLDDCPAGLSRISYRLDPLAGADAATSALALDPGASARGVAVQIRDRDGRPVAFGSSHELQAGHLGDGGSFRIPLQAAYYRGDAQPPQPGTVSASLTFTLSYE